ncbi:MAG: acyl-CoA/acyl-ACP dehydrogenase [Acidobacteriota bacterium]|nr:acyl-CoA/acyl-ACP dehydrogenase [Acidobacteriota bacterium]
MDLLPTPEQDEIAASVAAVLANELPTDRMRELMTAPVPIDRALWSRAGGLGWFTLGLPEGLGGVGYGLPEEALIFREIGKVIAPGPFAATVIATRLAAAAGDLELAGALGAGELVAGLGSPRAGTVMTLGAEVTGQLELYDAAWADLVLVLEPDAAVLVDASDLKNVTELACIDDATRLARGSFESAPARVWMADGNDFLHRGAVLVAAQLAGMAEAVRDRATAYAKVRVQFGHPIGSYQAVKHACADMAIRAEAAISQVFFAAVAVETGRRDAAFQASAAKIVAADAAHRNAAANVQIHGGMGFTFEQDAHLYVKRAHVLGQAFGSTALHLGLALQRGPQD